MNFSHDLFNKKTQILIINKINKILLRQDRCSLAITGGSSVLEIYNLLNKNALFRKNIYKIDFFFSDERCVKQSDRLSNFRLALSSLFYGFNISKISIFEIKGDAVNVNEEIERYSNLLPESLDLLLLSVGEDGHIASVFPNKMKLNDFKKKFLYVPDSPKLPRKRYSLSPKTINTAKHIILLAKSKKKDKYYQRLLRVQKILTSFQLD